MLPPREPRRTGRAGPAGDFASGGQMEVGMKLLSTILVNALILCIVGAVGVAVGLAVGILLGVL